jgi:hypothetical protein
VFLGFLEPLVCVTSIAIPLYRDPTLQCSKVNMTRYFANVVIPVYRDNSPLRITTYRTTNQYSNSNI